MDSVAIPFNVSVFTEGRKDKAMILNLYVQSFRTVFISGFGTHQRTFSGPPTIQRVG